MPIRPIDVSSKNGWQLLEGELPEDSEALAKEHKTLEIQFGPAKLQSAHDLLRLILLHAGTDLGLRQTVALMADSGGPSVSHVTLHKKMRLSAPLLRALVAREAEVRELATTDLLEQQGIQGRLPSAPQLQQLQQVNRNVALRGDGATMNTLVIENKGDVPIYVLAGTVVKGGNQDRQIGQDFVIDSHSVVPVDAFCIEHGRWTGMRAGVSTEGQFSAMKTLANAKVRAAGQYDTDQGKVWAEVGKVNASNKKNASSGTLMATLDDEQILKEQAALSARVTEHLGSVSSRRHAVGLAYAVDGEIKGLRWFANHRIFELFEDTLVNTAAVDAITARGGEPPKPAPTLASGAVKQFVIEMDSIESQRSAETAAENVNDYAETPRGYRSETKLKPKSGASSAKMISKDYLKK